MGKGCGQHRQCTQCYGVGGCELCEWTGKLPCPCERGDSNGQQWRHGTACVATECVECGDLIAADASVLYRVGMSQTVAHPECVTSQGAPHGVAQLPL